MTVTNPNPTVKDKQDPDLDLIAKKNPDPFLSLAKPRNLYTENPVYVPDLHRVLRVDLIETIMDLDNN